MRPNKKLFLFFLCLSLIVVKANAGSIIEPCNIDLNLVGEECSLRFSAAAKPWGPISFDSYIYNDDTKIIGKLINTCPFDIDRLSIYFIDQNRHTLGSIELENIETNSESEFHKILKNNQLDMQVGLVFYDLDIGEEDFYPVLVSSCENVNNRRS